VFGRRKTFPLAAIALAAVHTGCLLNFGLDTGPGFGLIQSVVATGEALPEVARAAGGTAAATVSGQIVGKLPCDEVNGEVKVNGDELRVIITLRADRQVCSGIAPTTFSYIANLLNIGAGNRPIVVEHRYVGVDGIDGVRLDTIIVVG
jgi:hypothetical protein